MSPSRQERRKAERDAAKRAPDRARAAGAGGAAAAAARANVNVAPLGDWTTQTEDSWALFDALGAQAVKQRAGEGDRQGLTLIHFSAEPEPFLTQNTPYTLPIVSNITPCNHPPNSPCMHPLSHTKR